MTTPRRRTPVADLFEEAFRLYKGNFLLLFAIGALVQIPVLLATVPMMDWQRQWITPMTNPSAFLTVNTFAPFVGWFLLVSVLGAVLGAFGQAAMVYVTGRGRSGDRPPPRDVARAIWRLTPTLLGFVLIVFGGVLALLVALVGVVAGFAIIGSLLGEPGLGVLLAVAAFLGGLVAYLVLTIRLILAVPVFVLEHRSTIPALRRSWNLVGGSVWRTAGIFGLALIAVGVLGSVVSPLYFPGVAEGFLAGSTASYLLFAVVSGLINALLTPILPILLVLLYFDYSRSPSAPAP